MSADVLARLVTALRTTAARLRDGGAYQWGHFGACNCGHLAQTLTKRSAAEIHAAAVQRACDWGDATVDYCPTSGLPLDAILAEMLGAGLTLSDVRHFEQLSDRQVLRRLPAGQRELRRNDRAHVVRYLEAWADAVAERLEAAGHSRPARMAAE